MNDKNDPQNKAANAYYIRINKTTVTHIARVAVSAICRARALKYYGSGGGAPYIILYTSGYIIIVHNNIIFYTVVAVVVIVVQ